MFSIEERVFVLKTLYKGGYNLILNEWKINFNTVPPSRKTVYNLRQRFEGTGSTPGSRSTGRPALGDEFKE